MSWFPSRMARVDVIVPDEHRDGVIARLHEEGLVELRDVRRENVKGKEFLDRPDAHTLVDEMEELHGRLIRSQQIMGKTLPPGPGGVAELFGKKPDTRIAVEPRSTEAIIGSSKELLGKMEESLLQADEKHDKISQQIEVLKARYYAVDLVKHLDVDLGYIGKSNFTFVVVGTTPDPDKIKEAVSPFKAVVESSSVDKAQHVVLVSGMRREEKEIIPLLRNAGFYPMDIGRASGSAEKEMSRIDSVIGSLEKSCEEIMGDIGQIRKKHYSQTLVVREEMHFEIEKAVAVQKLGRTANTHLISTWCPQKTVPRLEKIVEESSKATGAVYVQEPDEEPPSLMANPRWSGPFQSLTEMFGTPGYMEIDPTKIITPVFVLFFGLMLGDALYGALMTLTAVLLFRGSKKYGESLRQFSIILICAGLSTIFFGIIQGGYFGPIIETQPNLIMLMGYTPPVLLDAMKDPIFLLVISLIVGLIYINTALFLAAVQNIKRKEYKNVLIQQAPWWFLQPASFVLLGGGLFGWWTFSSDVVMAAYIMTIIGIILLFLDKKGLFFFELTGFIGNFLSFARLLALGLATAGIALTINVIIGLITGVEMSLGPLALVVLAAGAGLAGFGIYKKKNVLILVGALAAAFGLLDVLGMTSVFFVVMSALMYVFAHVINCALQALGAFVHALRLQYVEFFGFFYEGTGRAFKPFRPERLETILLTKEGRK